MGRLDHHPEGVDADPVQARDDRERRRGIQPTRLHSGLAHLAQSQVFFAGRSVVAFRRAGPRFHRTAADAGDERRCGGPRWRAPGAALSIKALILTPRAFTAFVLGASAGVLGGALGFPYWGGLAPCGLGLLQRWARGVALRI